MSEANFTIDAKPVGGSIVVNGEDVTGAVVAAEVRVGMLDPTVLVLHMVPGAGPIRGQGIVEVHTHNDDDTAVILGFLNAINPADLEARAATGAGWGTSTGEAFLAALRDLLT